MDNPERAFARHLGSRIRIARRERGVTREDLADRLQVDLSAITRYESGKRSLSAERLARIAHILHKPIGFFSEGFVFTPDPFLIRGPLG